MGQPSTTTPDVPAPGEPGVQRVHWRRRLFGGLLLLLAIAGGAWWNSTRLNETERKLVGVWKYDFSSGDAAIMLFPDRRVVRLKKRATAWIVSPATHQRWLAATGSLKFRPSPEFPVTVSVKEWKTFVLAYWDSRESQDTQISHLADDELKYQWTTEKGATATVSLYRSTDPELLRIFDRLSAGEAP